jgi:formylglycine-generating enzyme required for sulfatase activity
MGVDKQRIDVFISSTSIDLPAHRAAVREAILSLGMFPSGMENWPATGENPVALCRQKVEDADIYVGIYAYRYGWRPDGGGGGKSITELEYDWAADVIRDGEPIPRLCFIMRDDFPWPKTAMETEAEAELNAFKARVKGRHIVGFFGTPDDLKAQVTAALAPYTHQLSARALTPYLRWLHDQSKKSGLLRVLSPRDAGSDQKPVSVEQVYTPLNTTQTVLRDPRGKLLMNTPNSEAAAMKRTRDSLQQSPLTAMEAADFASRLVLLGDPGSGKSTFVSFLALCATGALLEADDASPWLARLRDQGWTHGAKMPIFITLRDFAQDVGDAQDGGAALLYAHIERGLRKVELGESFPAIKVALDAGDALVLLDGLDEVPSDKRELVRDAVTGFIERCHPGNRFIITCRVLSYANPDWQIPQTASHTLAPLDDDQIRHFVGAWYTALIALRDIDAHTAAQRVDDLTDALADDKLRSLAANPMLLTVMAIVHNHTGALPRENARLYDECVKLLMLRWRPHDARTLLETLGVREDDLYRLLWEIAYDAHVNQAEREGAADIPESAVLGIARKRLGDLSKAEAFCDYVELRAGLLIGRGEDAYGYKVYTFPHRTFQEYLAGCHLAAERFTRQLPEHARRGASWREALLLATGHLIYNARDVATPLDAINALLPASLQPATDDDWRVVWLAGEMLLLVGVANAENDDVGRDVLPRVRSRLAALVGDGRLPPVERAAAGRTLGLLGDPRPGVALIHPTPGISPHAERGEGVPEIIWRKIEAGPFLMGSDKAHDSRTQDDETPQRLVDVPYDYWISQYPVTNAQFAPFVDDDGYNNPAYWTEAGWEQRQRENWTQPLYWDDPTWNISNHPVVGVSWYEAYAYTRWLDALLRQSDVESPGALVIRLPTEQEWEKAARGTDWRVYPYPGAFDPTKGNTGESGIGQTSAVGIFPAGASPYGALDMSGNVWDWCLNKYDDSEQTGVDASGAWRVLRGGSWAYVQGFARAAYRIHIVPYDRDYNVGFRLCRPPSRQP